MSHHVAVVEWTLEGDFASGRYSRGHRVQFDSGVKLVGSASLQVVPPPFARADGVDPEEMFTASLSACHMLWFLQLARDAGLMVLSYRDEATGLMAKNREGRMAMTEVVLNPMIAFSGRQPPPEEIKALHHRAHDACFIANSVTTKIRVKTGG